MASTRYKVSLRLLVTLTGMTVLVLLATCTPTTTDDVLPASSVTAVPTGVSSTAGPAVPTPSSSTLPAEMDAWLREIAEPAGFKGAVLVARGNEILLDKGYGLFDVQQDIPNTPTTRFNINYLTMPFTAMAVLQLDERGLLNIDDPFCSYREDCPPQWQGITIHHLLSCSSGIPEYFGIPDLLARQGTPIAHDYLLERVGELPLRFRPGERWWWCETNYLLLAQIIERVSGRTYHQFIQENILDPLGMSDTGFGVVPEMAVQYQSPMSEMKSIRPFVENYHGAGDMVSTAEDLFRWARALRGESHLSQASLDRMFKRHLYGGWSPEEQTLTAYIGYPWFVDVSSFPQPNSMSIGGFQYGFTAVLALFPDADLTVIVLSNQENIVEPDALDLARDLANMSLAGQ